MSENQTDHPGSSTPEKKTPPWAKIGIVGGVILALCICVSLIGIGYSSWSRNQASAVSSHNDRDTSNDDRDTNNDDRDTNSEDTDTSSEDTDTDEPQVQEVPSEDVTESENSELSAIGGPGRIAFVTEEGISIINADGSEQSTIAFPMEASNLAWSSNGEMFAFDTFTPSISAENIFIVNFDGTGLTNLTQGVTGDQYTSPAFSPDGTKIAFYSPTSTYTMDIDGSNITLLIEEGHDLCWSPDGSKVAYSGWDAVGSNIFIANGDGTNSIRLTGGQDNATTRTENWNPAWSPDGTEIAFEAFDRGSGADIFLVSVSGTDLRRLYTCESGNLTGPSWSPDGTRLVFSCDASIYVMFADGTGLSRIAERGKYPVWNP